MKKFLSLVLCVIMILSVSACGKKKIDEPNKVPLRDIPTAGADSEEKSDNDSDSDAAENEEDKGKPSEESRSNGGRTKETDRSEIENNLKDASELVANGYYDDAAMIINGLKTRELTDGEKKVIEDLQKQMLKVSD